MRPLNGKRSGIRFLVKNEWCCILIMYTTTTILMCIQLYIMQQRVLETLDHRPYIELKTRSRASKTLFWHLVRDIGNCMQLLGFTMLGSNHSFN